MWPKLLKRRESSVVVIAAIVVTALIAALDRRIHLQVPLALLYFLPAALAGTGLTRWQVPIFGAFCTIVAELADAFPWRPSEGIPRDALYFVAYTTVSLYVSETISNRQREREHLRIVELEAEARHHAEEQLQLLVSTSSIAIITSDEEGGIVNANDAAKKIFAGSAYPAELKGRTIASLVPALARAPMMGRGPRQVKTMMQCQGVRADFEPFFADVWFSTYPTREGNRLTAMIADSSSEVRDREQANLEQVLNGSRLLVGAVSHEIRNICAAIGFVQQNLTLKQAGLQQSEDFQALRQLTSALERLASVELSQVNHQASQVHLDSFVRELRIILGPSLRDAGIAVQWADAGQLPTVWADPQSLLQVFLNLIRNSEAALQGRPEPRLALSIEASETSVQMRIADNGPGIANPEELFHPFQTANRRSSPIGFGLYLSRALLTSFRGDLRYEGDERGAVFVVELLAADFARPTREIARP